MYAVILAGGGGTRLWPLSRVDKPKPFLPLLGNQTLIQATVARLAPLIEPNDVYVVTDRRYTALAREQLPEVPGDNVLGEPAGRNTAAAVAFAALAIERPADDVMVILPADHAIADVAGFRRALQTAAAAASDGETDEERPFVTLGIAPTGPETGFGYVVASEQVQDGTGDRAYAVERFVEKPDRAAAQELIAGGHASWNAGIFVWQRGSLLAALDHWAPHIMGPLRAALDSEHVADLAVTYAALRATSIDYTLLEPASLAGRVRVVPAEIGWSDLGSWAALLDALPDSSSAVTVAGSGHGEDEGSEGVLVHSSADRLVVTVGLRGTIVVDTPDVVLVCARDRAQDVKRIVERLAAAKKTEYL